MTLELVRNPDILQTIGEWREARPGKREPVVVRIAAATMELERTALDKLARKKCDYIVANNVTQAGAGFGTDTNIVSIYGTDGFAEHLPQMSKKAVAQRVLELAKTKIGTDRE